MQLMIHVYIEISKYLILLLAALYTFCNFRYFTAAEAERKSDYCGLQQKIVLLLHLIAFSVLFFQTEDVRFLYFYLAQAAFLLIYPAVLRLLYRNISRLLLNNVCFFLALGLIMLTRLSFSEALRQFILICMGALLTLPVPLVMDRVLGLINWRWLYFALGLGLLCTVLVAGRTSYGAKMALSAGGFSFQPAEFVKISFVFFTAAMLQHSLSFKNICLTSAGAALHVLVLIACKDLGTALIFFTAYLVMLYAATNRSIYIVLGFGALSAAGAAAYRLFSHVRTRVAAWENPWRDIPNKGYQIAHSLFAIGTGGWAGMGLMQGLPGRIPIVEKDFIFSAISEEMGAVTAVCLILICLGCFLQMILTALYMDMLFYKLAAVGLAATYIMQVFLTVGGVTKFIPLTGVTLPFVAYGGSSVLSSFLLFMIIQGMHLIMMNEAEDDAEGFSDEEELPDDAERQEWVDAAEERERVWTE